MRLDRVLVLVIASACFLSPLAGQWVNVQTPGVPRTPDGKPNLSASAPQAPDGKPDLSGLWEMEHNRTAPLTGNQMCTPTSLEFSNIAISLKDGLPYQSSAAELMKARQAENRVHDPLSHCLPVGIVRLHTFAGFRKIIQLPGLLVILNELNGSYRQIFTDGRKLPADPLPAWNGYSTGKWDGDTLVVQSEGFPDGLWLDTLGHPLTDRAKITERLRRVNFGNLQIEITVEDPKAYTKPWTVSLNQTIGLDTDLIDYICNENEKDVQHFVVK